MNIKTRKLTRGSLSGIATINLQILTEAIHHIANLDPRYENAIGAHVVSTKEYATLQIFSFNQKLLSDFILAIMVESSKKNNTIKFSNKNLENLWNPTWSNIINLDHGPNNVGELYQ